MRGSRIVGIGLAACAAIAVAGRATAVAKTKGPKTLVYVNDSAGRDQVFGWALAADGTMEPLPGSPYAADWNGPNCGGPCNTMAYSARRKVLVTGTGGGITVWRIADDGSLTVVPGSPFGSGIDISIGTRVVEVGKRAFAYTAVQNESELRCWEILADGTLAELASSPVPAAAGTVALDASRRRLIGVGSVFSQPSTITSWLVGRDGSLRQVDGTPVAGVTNAFSARVEPKGRVVFSAGEVASVAAFRFDVRKGTLVPAEDSPFDSGFEATFDVVVPSSRGHLLVSSSDEGGAGDLRMFRFDAKGALTPLGGPQDSGLSLLDSGSFTPDGKTLILASKYTASVRSYSVDLKTGALTARDTESLGIGGLQLNEVLVVRR